MGKQYTDEYLLDYIRDRTEELGRPPKKDEIKHQYIIRRRFGGHNKAITLALGGNKVFNYLKDKHLKTKMIPLISEVRNDSFEVFRLIIDLYGGYKEALDELGINKVHNAFYKKVGEEIRNKRKSKDITLDKMSDITGIKFVKLVDIEKGRRITSKNMMNLDLVFKVLDIDVKILDQYLQDTYENFINGTIKDTPNKQFEDDGYDGLNTKEITDRLDKIEDMLTIIWNKLNSE